MGGTTAKAALIDDGEAQRSLDFEVARVDRFRKGSGLPLKVPVIDMIEIGAGGADFLAGRNLRDANLPPRIAGRPLVRLDLDDDDGGAYV